MPVPDMSGVPPWASFEDLKNKLNDLVAKYNNLLVGLDSLNVVSLTADHIDAGTLNAGVVTVRSDLTGGAYVQIDDTGLTINDGAVSTFRADVTGKVTMTGALIKSKTGFPAAVMDPDTDLFGAYKDAGNFIRIIADYAGAPALEFYNQGSQRFVISTLLGYPEFSSNGSLDFLSGGGGSIKLFSDGDIYLNHNGKIKVPRFSDLVDTSTGRSAASAGISTGGSGGHNHGIPDGTQFKDINGITRTFTSAPNHTHAQN